MNISPHPSSSPWDKGPKRKAGPVVVPQVNVIPPYQGPNVSYATAPKPRTAPKPPRPMRPVRNLVIFMLGFSVLFFGGSYFMSPTPHVESQVVGVGFASLGDRDIALVPYGRDGGRGMFELMFQPMFQQRLAAVDIETGKRVWDVSLKADLVWDAGVLGAGKTYAYLTTSDGLIIVKLSDGSIVARDGEIDGLGSDFVAAYPAYGFDAASNVIVALAADGGIRSIPLDSLTAGPADAATSAAWTGRLNDGPFAPFSPTATADEARLDGTDHVAVQPTTAGSLASTLVRLDARGDATPIGNTTFYNAAIVLDLTTLPDDGFEEATAQAGADSRSLDVQIDEILEKGAADGLSEDEIDELIQEATKKAAGMGSPGTGSSGDEVPAAAASALGFVLVQHAENQNDDDLMLSVVSLETGKIVSSTPMGSHAERAMTSPSGMAVVNVTPVGESFARDLAVVGADGKITRIEIGATNFFGFPA